MRFWPEVHWSEGQFLRPHHLQAAFRNMESLRIAAITALHPHAWGFLSLDLATEAIETNLIDIRAAELLLSDGTYVKVPENSTVDPRDFKAAFDKHNGPMPIYFGVPQVQVVRPNVLPPGQLPDGRAPRYAIDLAERYDENTGENPQSIEVRRMRGAFFFGEEDRSGYECVLLGRVERSAAGPTLSKNAVPPLMRLRAWAPLCVALESVWSEIRARCEQLGGDAAERALTFATASPGDMEQLVKLQALNELTVRFGMFVGEPDRHPHALYALLCDSIARLTIWDDLRRPRELPAYAHDDSGPTFEELFRYLRLLVNGMLPKDYIERPFEQTADGFQVELDHEWFTPNHELYMGIRSNSSTEDIMTLFRGINFRLASPNDAMEVYRRRLPGLAFTPAGTVRNLPKTSDINYFRIARTPPYWQNCETQRAIGIKMPPQELSRLSGMRLSLFVVKVR